MSRTGERFSVSATSGTESKMSSVYQTVRVQAAGLTCGDKALSLSCFEVVETGVE
jgi:hypothetical protein